MADQSRASSRDLSLPSSYPRLSAAAGEALHRTLADVVSLLHDGNLTVAQRDELAASIAIQIRNTERLHEFPLSNADEPAFVAALSRSASDD